MAGRDYTFRFVYPPASANNDTRTVQVVQVLEGSPEGIEFYKFYHPVTGSTLGSTSFHRMNLEVHRWETAGCLDWVTNFNATVYLGTEKTSLRELRKMKKASSRSRRFKIGSSEYKWKITPNDGLVCTSLSWGRIIATWDPASLTLQVAERAEPVLDRIMVTCYLNVWMKDHNMW